MILRKIGPIIHQGHEILQLHKWHLDAHNFADLDDVIYFAKKLKAEAEERKDEQPAG